MDKDGGGGGDGGGDGGDDVRTLCHHDDEKVSTDPTELTIACRVLRTPTWYRLDKKTQLGNLCHYLFATCSQLKGSLPNPGASFTACFRKMPSVLGIVQITPPPTPNLGSLFTI